MFRRSTAIPTHVQLGVHAALTQAHASDSASYSAISASCCIDPNKSTPRRSTKTECTQWGKPVPNSHPVGSHGTECTADGTSAADTDDESQRAVRAVCSPFTISATEVRTSSVLLIMPSTLSILLWR